MKVLVGIDVQPIAEVQASLKTFGARYASRIFTAHELDVCGNNSMTASHLAARFAAKEAVLKILDLKEEVPSWRSIEVKGGLNGRAEIALHGRAADLARHEGIRDFSVGLSHAGGVASAAVLAELESRPKEPL